MSSRSSIGFWPTMTFDVSWNNGSMKADSFCTASVIALMSVFMMWRDSVAELVQLVARVALQLRPHVRRVRGHVALVVGARVVDAIHTAVGLGEPVERVGARGLELERVLIIHRGLGEAAQADQRRAARHVTHGER